MICRVVTLALLLMLSWTGVSGLERLASPVMTDVAAERGEAVRDTTLHRAPSDGGAADVADEADAADAPDPADPAQAQDLIAPTAAVLACGATPARASKPDDLQALPTPWLAMPQRPPRRV